MADLSCNIAGIKSPNPFWLASAPPTDKKYNVVRAFEAGWGGVVWKTLGEDPPVVNVSSRYGAVDLNGQRMMGFNNIELISDRPLELNLREIKETKREWPDRAMIVSLMVPCEENSWKNIVKKVEDTGADGIELNFGCPHGMSERGMGAAVGQVPEYVEMVTKWCKTYSRMPVLVKLTPNIADVCIQCGLCYIACEDTSHQSISALRVDGKRKYEIIDHECVGCNLCYLACPEPGALDMIPQKATKEYLNWTKHPNNPMAKS